MAGQMSWLPTLGTDGEKVLHLRTAPNEPWQPYNTFPQFSAPDYPEPDGSKGWATYQKLSRQGWKLIPTAQARNFSLVDVR